MTWVAWRQFRTQTLVTLGLLAALAALVLITGLHLRDVYSSLGGPRCAPNGDCYQLVGHEQALADVLGPVLLAVPALIGMFWGAPLVARELETGTYRLAWTQSISRRRWLTVKVALVGVAALAVAGLASWLVSWWYAPLDAVQMNRLDPSVFTARGVVAIGYTGFAFVLGVAAGALIRRTLPAMVATLIGFVAVRVAITFWIRPHLLPASHALVPVTAGKGIGFISSPTGISLASGVPPFPNAWMLSATLVNRAHHALTTARLHELLIRTCPRITTFAPFSARANAYAVACQQRLAPQLRQLVAYQPPSHYWSLQALEAGIFLAAATAVLAATLWQVAPRATTAIARRPRARGYRRSGEPTIS